ncbi:hypothetical protein LOTGIDRAFT_153686 [Lottia gigantea]|uniref:G-protein coupled receptors family 1 profile domain-containing protein n=1 Tax=Lottia gigantea TaxID=225164 RepID=V4A880_LOTGI|nr:hypothetical protein LOTGIDRAFT_153686 [Lottia gigantea]ESO91255.1 hypothetical protein LOTGIDRAFT_153686 [Lottia gigantea]
MAVSNFTTPDGIDVQIEETPPEETAIVCILIILSVFGSVGNGLVLYVFSRKMDNVTSTIFILALAGTDFITCLVIIPFTAVAIVLQNHLKYDFFCKLYHFLITCNVPLSAFIMVAIAVDRYFCICKPFLHAMNPFRAKVVVLFLGIFSFILGTITSLAFGVYHPVSNNNTTHNSTDSENYNGTNVNEMYLEYSTHCQANYLLISGSVIKIYQNVYASFYLIALIIVLILYMIIYKSVIKRRKWRQRQRSSRPSGKSVATCVTEIEVMEMPENNGVNNVKHEECVRLNSETRKSTKIKRDYDFLANIRTAFMLFVVTVVFIIAFLPSWLMAKRLIQFNIIIFYMYFVYNVANPVIYSFMNQTFRKELKNVFQRGRKCVIR